MSEKPTILIATATFNEASNITEWHSRIRSCHADVDLLIVDDSSPDGTADVVRGLQVDDPRLHLLVRPAKSGLGSAHRAAMLYAREHEFSNLVTMDADLSHQPEQLGPFLALIPEYDFVIGTRSGAGSCDYEGFRKFVSLAGNRAARVFIPTGLTEYTTSMRAFSPRAVEVLLTTGIRDDGYAFFMEVVETLYQAGCRMTEVPIHFMDRTRGASKIPKHQIWLSASALARLSSRRLVRRRSSATVSSL